MHNRPPPREIPQIISFPPNEENEMAITKVYNRVLHKTELLRRRDEKCKARIIKYNLGDKVLIRNRQLPSSIEGIDTKLLLLYHGPFIVTKDNRNNTYELSLPNSNQIKGTYNQKEMKKFYEN